MRAQTKVHYHACNLCEAICGLEIHTRKGEVVAIKGDKHDPLSQGHICPKAIALQDIYSDTERLRHPMRKTAEGWQEISWTQAFEEIVKGFRKVQREYGNDAVGVYQGNPNVHSLGLMLCGNLLLKELRTRNRYTATSIDQLPHHLVAGLMFGHEMLLPIPDIDRTQFMVMLGANPLVSNGSMMTVPAVGKRLKALQARGGKFWVVDPRRTETAELANEHVFITPGADAHLLAAMISVIFEEGLQKDSHLISLADGVEELRPLLAPWTPERVEPLTGISAETVRRLVREFCAAESAVLYGRMGVSTQQFGSLCQWLIVIFNFLSGNLDKEGGAMFTTPAVDILASRKKRTQKTFFSFNQFQSRVKSLPEMQGELPVTTLLDELVTPGPGQIKAMLLIAGNPVLSTPNGQCLSEALEKLDFMVAVDCYINESTRHANIILPPATIFERDHYDLVFHALAVRNTARFSQAIFPVAKNTKNDAEILLQLAARMSHPDGKISWFKSLQLKYFYRSRIRKRVDKALKLGPYGKTQNLNLKKLLSSKHGLDLGPLQQRLPERLFNENKRIQLVPKEIVKDLPRLQMQLMDRTSTHEKFTSNMLLIGRRDPRTCNSWLHNSARMTKGKDRCLAFIHYEDVRRLQLEGANTVRVSSASGSIEVEFRATDAIKPGVISIPHGWGHNLPGVQMSCAVAHSGVSVNDLTCNDFYDEVSGNAALNGVPVKVERSHSG